MDKWVQHSIRRGILNQVKANKIKATLAYAPDIIREVTGTKAADGGVAAKGTIVSAAMKDPETGEILDVV